jgi:hypothetical protein
MGYKGGGEGGETKNGSSVRIFFLAISRTVASRVSRVIWWMAISLSFVSLSACKRLSLMKWALRFSRFERQTIWEISA